jgi:hypothetical protein
LPAVSTETMSLIKLSVSILDAHLVPAIPAKMKVQPQYRATVKQQK